jgi:hypothetical protein
MAYVDWEQREVEINRKNNIGFTKVRNVSFTKGDPTV